MMEGVNEEEKEKEKPEDPLDERGIGGYIHIFFLRQRYLSLLFSSLLDLISLQMLADGLKSAPIFLLFFFLSFNYFLM